MKKAKVINSEGLLDKLKDLALVFGCSILLLTGFKALIDSFRCSVDLLPLWWNPSPYSAAYYVISACVLAPLIEELLYRVLPIKLLGTLKASKTQLWLLVGMLSIIFGYMHGSAWNVLLQGTFGMLLSWLYIKHQSYLLNVSAHAMYNTFIYFGAPLLCNLN